MRSAIWCRQLVPEATTAVSLGRASIIGNQRSRDLVREITVVAEHAEGAGHPAAPGLEEPRRRPGQAFEHRRRPSSDPTAPWRGSDRAPPPPRPVPDHRSCQRPALEEVRRRSPRTARQRSATSSAPSIPNCRYSSTKTDQHEGSRKTIGSLGSAKERQVVLGCAPEHRRAVRGSRPADRSRRDQSTSDHLQTRPPRAPPPLRDRPRVRGSAPRCRPTGSPARDCHPLAGFRLRNHLSNRCRAKGGIGASASRPRTRSARTPHRSPAEHRVGQARHERAEATQQIGGRDHPIDQPHAAALGAGRGPARP